MKNLYLSLLTIFIAASASAQCTLSLNISQDGNSISLISNGVGAVEPAYIIDWGDGTNSFASADSHTYTEDGNYTVCVNYLDQSNPVGCSASECQLIVVGGSGCAVEFTQITSGLFVAIEAVGAGGTNPVYTINWGDGTANTVGSESNHNYAASGEYTICVTYTTNECVAEACETLTVSSDVPCTVDATFVLEGNTLTVTSTGSGAVSPQFAISWGGNEPLQLISEGSYTYTQSGTYNVCVVYLDLLNQITCAATDCQEIILNVNVDESTIADGGVSVYPNPLGANSSIRLELNKPEFTVVELFNLVGEKVSTISAAQRPQGTSQINWNSSDLASGIYFIQVTAGAEKQTIKVIK